MQDLTARLLVAQGIAREAGLLALRMRAEPATLGIEMKGPQDFVTAADRAVEALIRARLAAAFPEDGFFGEETASDAEPDVHANLWVVDPIDGTSNFAAGRRDWCVSIGLVVAGHPMLGVIYQPVFNALTCALRGQGATRDGMPLRMPDRPMGQVTIGIDCSAALSVDQHLSQIKAVLATGAEYRRNGSAATSLAQVAAGQLDGFVEMSLSAWDVAAGIVIVEEAGGWCNDFFAGDGLRKGNILMASSIALRGFVEALSEI